MAAALNGNADLVRTLLGLRSDLNAASEDRVAVVKHGPVAFGRVTALHMGAPVATRRSSDCYCQPAPQWTLRMSVA